MVLFIILFGCFWGKELFEIYLSSLPLLSPPWPSIPGFYCIYILASSNPSLMPNLGDVPQHTRSLWGGEDACTKFLLPRAFDISSIADLAFDRATIPSFHLAFNQDIIPSFHPSLLDSIGTSNCIAEG